MASVLLWNRNPYLPRPENRDSWEWLSGKWRRNLSQSRRPRAGSGFRGEHWLFSTLRWWWLEVGHGGNIHITENNKPHKQSVLRQLSTAAEAKDWTRWRWGLTVMWVLCLLPWLLYLYPGQPSLCLRLTIILLFFVYGHVHLCVCLFIHRWVYRHMCAPACGS